MPSTNISIFYVLPLKGTSDLTGLSHCPNHPSVTFSCRYGGNVEVVHVNDGVCRLKYSGPVPIGEGIKAAIRDKFPDIREVVLED